MLGGLFSRKPPAEDAKAKASAAERNGTVQVGWLLADEKAAIVYFPPERVRSAEMNKTHAKSASRCPAIINMESRYFVVRCPFDMHLRFARNKDGKPGVRNMLGEASPVRPAKLNNLIHMTNEAEWRYPDRPTVQISLPYIFVADDPVHMSQVDAFMHYRAAPLPGTIFGGRFPIHLWPRPLMWAFEWHEPEKDLILKRGEPWFYVTFEGMAPDRPVQMVEAERTEDLSLYLEQISGAVNYVNQTFSLFKEAEKRRPETLLVPRKR
ncbi:MAG: hypothetical protein AAF367_04755 [Pseudomonadota bacterium]